MKGGALQAEGVDVNSLRYAKEEDWGVVPPALVRSRSFERFVREVVPGVRLEPWQRKLAEALCRGFDERGALSRLYVQRARRAVGFRPLRISVGERPVSLLARVCRRDVWMEEYRGVLAKWGDEATGELGVYCREGVESCEECEVATWPNGEDHVVVERRPFVFGFDVAEEGDLDELLLALLWSDYPRADLAFTPVRVDGIPARHALQWGQSDDAEELRGFADSLAEEFFEKVRRRGGPVDGFEEGGA